MNPRDDLQRVFKKVLRRLRFEQFIYRLQAGLFLAAMLVVCFLLLTRLFVFPHYEIYALLLGLAVLASYIVYIFFKRVSLQEAVWRFDTYFPHNLFVTTYNATVQNLLTTALMEQTNNHMKTAFQQFKKRKKQYLYPKMLTGFLACSFLFIILIISPSNAQLEAKTVREEEKIQEELKKEVDKLAKKNVKPLVKKELAKLSKELKEKETLEEILKEMVKKQKELKLAEQQLQKKETSNDKTEEEEVQRTIKDLKETTSQLAKGISNAQSDLTKIGRSPSPSMMKALSQLANGSKSSSNGSEDLNKGSNSNQNTNSSRSSDASPDQKSNSGQGGSASGQSGSSGQGGSGSGQSGSSGQGGSASGQSGSSGQGGSGSGQSGSSGQGGSGSGQSGSSGQGGLGFGQGAGSGQGVGQGSRSLLSIPADRLKGQEQQSIVKGPQGKGEFKEEFDSDQPVERGDIRPYQEVIGEYKDSYFNSQEKMTLSPELQKILSDYFTAIE